MADWEKMYSVLLCAIDQVIDPLAETKDGRKWAIFLQNAIREAEEIFIATDELQPVPSFDAGEFSADKGEE